MPASPTAEPVLYSGRVPPARAAGELRDFGGERRVGWERESGATVTID